MDMDGLLLDTERLQMEGGPDVIARLGYALPPQFFRRLVGVARHDAASIIGEEVGVPIDRLALDTAWDEAMDLRMENSVPLRPGVAAFFDALDRLGLAKAVATNSITGRAEWKLDHAGLLDRIDAVVGVDQVEAGKPAPYVYLRAAERIGRSPTECAAFDDSDLGVRDAMDAGPGSWFRYPTWWKAKPARHIAKFDPWTMRAPFSGCSSTVTVGRPSHLAGGADEP